MKQKIFFLWCIVSSLIEASPFSVDEGGTGLTASTAYAVLCGGTTSINPFQSVSYSGTGTGTQFLFSNGAGAAPTFNPAKEFAYIYTRTGSTITSGSAYLFELNGVMSSGISHSTSSNTDQIIINRAGTYLIVYTSNTSSGTNAIALTVDGGSANAESKVFATVGAFIAGQCILTFTAGQVLRVVNFIGSSITLSSGRVGGSITLRQII
jgi:hypothetical protein